MSHHNPREMLRKGLRLFFVISTPLLEERGRG